MAKLVGDISITGLPPHRGLIINLCFFAVSSADSPAPHDGDALSEAATDCEKVFEEVDLERELRATEFQYAFSVERPPGYYFLQLRLILFRIRDGKVFAQAEQFFFARHPVHLASEQGGKLTLPVSWPMQLLEELQRYGTVQPQKKRSWWRFW